MVDIANWADGEGHEAVPGSAPWHYVNVPITATRYDARFCSGGDCVVERIKHFRSVLADRRAPLRDRQRALLFLVHLVADVHQPLHVGDHHDKGGNLTQVQFLGAAGQPAPGLGLGHDQHDRPQRERLGRADQPAAHPGKRSGVVAGERRGLGDRESARRPEGLLLPRRRAPADREREPGSAATTWPSGGRSSSAGWPRRGSGWPMS